MNSKAPSDIAQSFPLGLEPAVHDRLAEISGGEPSLFRMQADDCGQWIEDRELSRVMRRRPMFITNAWNVIDPAHVNLNEDRPPRWHLSSVVWLDLDSSDIAESIAALRRTRVKLVKLDIDPEQCSLFATGSKGFHVAIPLALMVPGGIDTVGALTAGAWPRICKDFVTEHLLTDCTDLSVYSGGRGRMWRQPNVKRDNGAFKVAMPWAAVDALTPAAYSTWCSEPRELIEPAGVDQPAAGAYLAWGAALRKATRPSPAPKKRASGPILGVDGALLPTERSKIVAALKRIDADAVDYGTWLRVGAALKSTGAPDALQIWVVWSAGRHGRGESRSDPKRACESKWGGLRGDCALGTLFYLAKNGGRA